MGVTRVTISAAGGSVCRTRGIAPANCRQPMRARLAQQDEAGHIGSHDAAFHPRHR